MTQKIDLLKGGEDFLTKELLSYVEVKKYELKIAIIVFSIINIIVIMCAFFIGLKIYKSIGHSIKTLALGIEKFFKFINREEKELTLLSEEEHDEMSRVSHIINKNILQTKTTLEKNHKELQEAMALSKLYEYAIERSNIILRVSLDKKITYANQEFYEVSGYTADELIGKPYSYIKHPDMKENYVNEMFAYVDSGKIWKGTIKNITKSGAAHYSISTVVPIKNKNGELLEYMGIRQDITEVMNLHEEIEDTQREVIYKMGEIGEKRSQETGNHVKRVAEYSELLALKCGLEIEEANLLKLSSPMHDIGKVGIPDSILNKKGKLTEEEFTLMQEHTCAGYDMLKKSDMRIIKASAIVAHEHHERWDGTGYPRGIKGEEIHIYGRVTAICDVFDALATERPYKKAWDLDKILEYFRDEKGKHFDPRLTDIFLENIEEFTKIGENLKE